MSDTKTIIETTIIPHTAFVHAQRQLDLCFKFAAQKTEAEGLAIIGESGTGKTSVLTEFAVLHPTIRRKDGLEVPILRATVPSQPTVKSLAGVMLAALGAADAERGTENEKSSRLRTLIRNTGTRMVMIDEFQHFIDRNKKRVMREVADWMKVLIDDTNTTLIVAGLPSCTVVIDENEQLARRFLSPIELPRFSWIVPSQRKQFMGILAAFAEQIGRAYDLPDLHKDDMAFRFYCATGGLIGYLAKLLRQALRTADGQRKRIITLEDLDDAYRRAVWSRAFLETSHTPFDCRFRCSPDTLDEVKRIGRSTQQAIPPSRSSRPIAAESSSSMLVAS
jgi:hypothetical protein